MPEYTRLYPHDLLEDELMKITVSFENARRLKTLGLKQKSIFCYEIWFSPSNQKLYCLKQGASTSSEIYPAPTISELIRIAEEHGVLRAVLGGCFREAMVGNLADPNWWAERIIETMVL